MRILVVGNRFPWPLHDGGALATFQMLKAMAFEGHEVSYFSLNTQKHFVDEKTLFERFSFCKYYSFQINTNITPWKAFLNLLSNRSFHLQRYENTLANAQLSKLLQTEQFDLIQIEGLYSAGFLETLRANYKGHISFRAHNYETQIWERLASETSNFLKKVYLNIQAKRLKHEEVAFLKSVDSIVAIAPSDLDVFKEFTNVPQYLYLPGLNLGLEVDLELQPFKLFHIGSMEWMANVQGVEWFLQKVWPIVKSAYPQLEFHLAGKGLNDNDSRFFQSGVFNHGEVENAQSFMITHGICIVPVVAGSGIRMKLIEAMSLGIPCVTTEIGVQGINVENHVHVEIANSPKDFAQAIVFMIQRWHETIKMGTRGKKYMIEHHNLQNNTRELLAFYSKMRGKRD
jgi:polysaccharide biosynthesis protein PslH